VPAPQAGQAEATAEEYEPAAQEPLANNSPEVTQKLPARQETQVPVPADGWKLPEAQSAHTSAPAAEYWPAAQVPDTADKPAESHT